MWEKMSLQEYWIFKQDNDPKHENNLTSASFILPDINVIQHMCNILEKKISKGRIKT